MYALFSDPSRHYGGTASQAALNNFKKKTLEDLGRVISYYRNGTFFTRSDHLLVKLINTMATPLDYELDRYYEVSIARSLYVANSLQLTSSINVGKWFSGIFYFGCPELVICYNGLDSPEELAKDWRNLQPVKLLQTPISNLSYLIPTGRNHQVERGLAVIAVDIGMLMVMYRCFMLNEYRRVAENKDAALLSAHHFVGRFVLPNMLYSQTDLAIFNRMYNLAMGAPMGKAYAKHPMFISDYSSQCDKGLQEIIDNLSQTGKPFETYLANIPSLYSGFPLGMPDMAETRQVWWALFLTRIKAIEFLLDIAGEKGKRANGREIGQLKIAVKEFTSDGIFNQTLPPDLLSEVNYLFSNWKKL
jgi:hypothetical protein